MPVHYVTLQVIFMAQCQITYWALDRFVAVYCPLVIGQLSCCCELLVAEFASFGLQLFTYYFVCIQEIAAYEELIAAYAFRQQCQWSSGKYHQPGTILVVKSCSLRQYIHSLNSFII